jgi:hypothetical protein
MYKEYINATGCLNTIMGIYTVMQLHYLPPKFLDHKNENNIKQNNFTEKIM